MADEWDGDESDPEFRALLQAERDRRGLGRKPAARLLVAGLLVALLGPVLLFAVAAVAFAGGGSMRAGGVIGLGMIACVAVGLAMVVVGGWRMATRADSRP